MLASFVSLAPIFLTIVLGFILRKSGLIPGEHWRGVELISFWVLFPALLVTSMVRADIAPGELKAYALALAVMIALMCLLVWLLRPLLARWMGMKGPAYTTIYQSATRWNGFIAFAIVDKLFGHAGLAILAIAFAIMVPFLNVVNVLILAAYAGATRPTPRIIAAALLRNPLLWGIGLGILLKATGIVPPDPVMTTLNLLGRGALGVAMLALGAGLSWRAVRHAGPEVGLSVFLRLIVSPLIAWATGTALGVTGPAFLIMILAAGVPTAVSGYVFARTMGGDAELYAASLTVQVLVSFLTLPLIIALSMPPAG